MKALWSCVEHVRTRRKAGDARRLDDVISESIRLFSTQQKTEMLHAEVKRKFQQQLRKDCLEVVRPEDELAEPLPFESKELSYRCGPLVRVRREGEIDAVRPHHVRGDEIERNDSWEVAQRKRATAYSEDKRRHNKGVSVALQARFGLDPKTQTLNEMQATIDARTCVLCGDGPIAGDPMERDHETPIATEKGESVIGWAHRSCNRSKGKLEIDHLPIEK